MYINQIHPIPIRRDLYFTLIYSPLKRKRYTHSPLLFATAAQPQHRLLRVPTPLSASCEQCTPITRGGRRSVVASIDLNLNEYITPSSYPSVPFKPTHRSGSSSSLSLSFATTIDCGSRAGELETYHQQQGWHLLSGSIVWWWQGLHGFYDSPAQYGARAPHRNCYLLNWCKMRTRFSGLNT